MICVKCKQEIEDGSMYCRFCGRKQIREKVTKKRGNGQGTVYKDGDKYRAVVTIGYYTDESTGKRRRKTRSERFDSKKDAVAAIPRLSGEGTNEAKKKEITFKALYDLWVPTHDAGKDTLNCYKAAMKHFEPVWFIKMKDMDIEDLQECLDECGHGKRTQQNMKTACGLVYKYGIPRGYVPRDLNLSGFLTCSGNGPAARVSFTDAQLRNILRQVGKVWGAEYVYCLCYLGFRPSEFLELSAEDYDVEKQCIIGGAKTEAGRGRTVTVSPKIQPFMKLIRQRAKDSLVCDKDGKCYTLQYFTEQVFYPVLEAAGIENPSIEDEYGNKRHKYTPHSCRHTFATLMKRVPGASKDKQELIGHASEEMLRYYQDVGLEDLRAITDAL